MKTKPFLRSVVLTLLSGSILVLSTPGSAATFGSPMFGATADYVPGEVIVKFKPMVTAQERTASVAAQRGAVWADLKHRWVHVKLGAGQTVETALAAYRNDPAVEYVQPNYIYHITAAPNDPQYGQLWAFKNTGQTIAAGTYTPNSGTPGDDMNIEPAWGHITDCSSVVVAVVDSGVNYNQQDLAANMWNGGGAYPNHGWDYVDSDNDPMDLKGHGTHVAGIVGATGNNSLGTTGVCWKASIMAVRVLDAMGQGYTSTIIQGIDFAVTNGAKVINMSLGGGGLGDQAFSDVITAAQTSDVVVIVAAGNETNNNDTSATYPCNFSQANLLCVAALDQNYVLATFSNWGATSVDVGAPGTNILSTWAGAETTITDYFNTSGVLDWTTSGGWAYSQLTLSGSPIDVLVNPGSFPSGTYSNSADNRVYKAFNLSGNNVAILSFYTQFAIQPGDSLNINYRSSGGDPFVVGGVFLVGGSGTTPGVIGPLSYDISPCISATCSVGFQLLTDASGADQGVGILGFSIKKLQLNTSSYNTINGTSMASPEVAGLATMLRAYNPQYTCTDTINAIKSGGRSVAALTGKTTTGKAVDVMSSLAYIAPPTGLMATVQ
jgi:thermitase